MDFTHVKSMYLATWHWNTIVKTWGHGNNIVTEMESWEQKISAAKKSCVNKSVKQQDWTYMKLCEAKRGCGIGSKGNIDSREWWGVLITQLKDVGAVLGPDLPVKLWWADTVNTFRKLLPTGTQRCLPWAVILACLIAGRVCIHHCTRGPPSRRRLDPTGDV